MTGSGQSWRNELGIAALRPPVFFSSEADIATTEGVVPQALAMRRAFDRLELDGILCVQNNPLAYFREVRSINPNEVQRLHRRFWNQGLAPILILIDPNEIHIYSGLKLPSEDLQDLDRSSLVQKLSRVADQANVRQLLLSISSGEFFRIHAKCFDPKQRVDRSLLTNLQETRQALSAATTERLEAQILDALLCRIVFICYLFDRNVIGSAYLATIGIPSTSHLRDILGRPQEEAKEQLYLLFKQLGIDFNGDLFNEHLDLESKSIAGRHLTTLDHFLGGTDMATGQRAFWPYDFSMIPIETISAIYEHFLKAEDPEGKKKAGAFYTPRFLAEVTIDIALEGVTSLLDKRFLDPACGSGIFLVGLFNRLAEEWKRKYPNARYDRQVSALIDILRHNLCGVDINPTACRITAFSLYLALLDQLSPPDIQRLQRKGKMLPKLVSSSAKPDGEEAKTVHCGDFFSDQFVGDFDLVIGNPPWKSLDGAVSKAELWCREKLLPIANRQLAIAFMWKGALHQRAEGRVCFVLPHGVLFNHQDKAIAFQKAWLEKTSLDVVLNLADMRFNLFQAAVGPALVIRYHSDASPLKTQRVQYLVPKTSWAISQAEIVSVPSEDRTEFPLSEVLVDLRANRPARVWKERFWGTPRDWKFLDRLAELPPLSSITGAERSKKTPRWIIAEGLQPLGEADNPANAKDVALPTRLFVQANAIAKVFVLAETDCEKLPEPVYQSRRRTNTNIFKAPHVLVSKGLNVAFADFAVVFRHAVRGIQGPPADRDLLIFLAAYLRSPLARYFFFHTSSRWGIERAEVEVAELLRAPFPLPAQAPFPDQASAAVAKVARKIESFADTSVGILEDREQLVQDLQSECDELVYEYFAIGDVERSLIEDTVSISMRSILPPRASANLPTLKESSPAYRREYTDLLCETLNDWTRGGAYRINAQVQSSSGSGMAAVILKRLKSGSTVAQAANHELDGLLLLLDRLQKTFATDMGSVELVRGVKVFDGDTLYLLKSLDQRFWTRTAALNDADEIATTVLLQSRRERLG